jgi:hypothetical protein
MAKKLPKTMYVRWGGDEQYTWLEAYVSLQEAVDGDGPTEIGSYTLASTDKVRKIVKVDKQGVRK